MTIANFDEIDEFAREAYRLAEESAGVIKFSVTEGLTKNSRSITASAPYHIGNTPQFVSLETTHGVAGWAVLLAVDLRKSSDRAVRIGAKKTFLTMHTYIPTMAELVVRNGGKVGSLRGDGLFAVFGFKENTYPSRPVTEAEGAAAINNATCCGRAMIEATKEILNPILSEKEIEAGLVVGVGMSTGEVVVTQIGVDDAVERTLYGTPVNHACKASGGHNEIILAQSAKDIYPTAVGGTAGFRSRPLAGGLNGYLLDLPASFRGMAQRQVPQRRLPR
jgi:class 3 adenylate cyclase